MCPAHQSTRALLKVASLDHRAWILGVEVDRGAESREERREGAKPPEREGEKRSLRRRHKPQFTRTSLPFSCGRLGSNTVSAQPGSISVCPLNRWTRAGPLVATDTRLGRGQTNGLVTRESETCQALALPSPLDVEPRSESSRNRGQTKRNRDQ